MTATEDEVIILKRIAAMPFSAEFDIGVGTPKPVFVEATHEGMTMNGLRDMALKGWLFKTEGEAIKRYCMPPRLVITYTITALGRHIAGIRRPPPERLHRSVAL